MAWPFRRKQPALPARTLTKGEADLVSAAELNGVSAVVEHEMRKTLTAAHYVAFDNVDDQGGYFGTEFEIRTTAGRIKGLYSREPWIFASATQIARTLSQVPFKVYPVGGDQDLPKHPLKALLDSGTMTQSPMETRWTLYLDLVLGGNYILLLEEDMKTIAGIAPVELVSFQYSADFSRVEFVDVYAAGGSQQAVRFPYAQCIHVKLPNPYNFLYGMSPFAAAARPILLDRYKHEFEMAFYLRGATSTGVVETTEDLSKSRFQRMMRTFEQAFTGRANWWRTLFLPKGATWKSSSLTMAEMQHLEGLKENRKTILAVLGIPPSMVGLIEDVNRATAEQQERVYWQNTIVPMAHFVAAGWNGSYLLKTVYKGKFEVRPDFTGIEAVEGFASARAEKAKAMEPYYWIDEIREKVWGDEPLPDGAGAKLVAEVKSAGQGPVVLAMPGAAVPDEKPALPVASRAVEFPEGAEVQTLIFEKAQFGQSEAQKWAQDHGYKGDKVDETSESWRIRQHDPDLYDQETMRTIVLQDGVQAVIGERKDPGLEAGKAWLERAKAAATSSQNRIEGRLSSDMTRALDAYLDLTLAAAERAIRAKEDVRAALGRSRQEREAAYFDAAEGVYVAALERGYSAAASQVRTMANVHVKDTTVAFPGLDETDRQALDVIRERTRDGRRRTLVERAIDRFKGFDETRTEAIMQLVEDGEKAGQTFEQIARTIRDAYGETYGGQARTIVRTEILSAVSEGLAWNHETLAQVFTKVQKQWIHQGDAAINDDAREEHVELEEMGAIDGDTNWEVVDPGTGQQVTLRYPRDPSAPAGQIINCRCSMVTVIPDDAASNAEAILETT